MLEYSFLTMTGATHPTDELVPPRTYAGRAPAPRLREEDRIICLELLAVDLDCIGRRFQDLCDTSARLFSETEPSRRFTKSREIRAVECLAPKCRVKDISFPNRGLRKLASRNVGPIHHSKSLLRRQRALQRIKRSTTAKRYASTSQRAPRHAVQNG